MKKFIGIILAIFIGISCAFSTENNNTSQHQIGIIKNINYEDINTSEYTQVKQIAEIKIVKGELKGSIVTAENMLTGNPFYDINLKQGMKVILNIEEASNGVTYSIEDVCRSPVLIWLAVLFCALLIYVGKIKGLSSLISIAITCVLIFNLLSPLILLGISPILATIIICIISTVITMYLVGGFNKKSSSAALGCILSIFFAGILSFLTVKFAHLTGFTDESYMFLFSTHPQLDFIGIVISVMLLATLGAVMDVAMSIASTINEIYTIDNTKTTKELFTSGMNVGRDIIGTMANTLILVYLGGSLPLLLLASNIDLYKFINLNQVVTEISSALIGSCAIVICVPLTAIVSSILVKSIKTSQKDILLKDNIE